MSPVTCARSCVDRVLQRPTQPAEETTEKGFGLHDRFSILPQILLTMREVAPPLLLPHRGLSDFLGCAK